jgi:hypothetical protein
MLSVRTELPEACRRHVSVLVAVPAVAERLLNAADIGAAHANTQ